MEQPFHTEYHCISVRYVRCAHEYWDVYVGQANIVSVKDVDNTLCHIQMRVYGKIINT